MSQDTFSSVKLRPETGFLRFKSVTTHSKQEVLTRRWQDLAGATMMLIDFRVEQIEGRPTVAIAKYGDKATGRIHCVDIFEHKLTADPSDATLFLLCHDSRTGWVTDLQIERKDNQVFFNFTREFLNSATSKTIRNWYSYRYEKESGFSNTTGDFYAELTRIRHPKPSVGSGLPGSKTHTEK